MAKVLKLKEKDLLPSILPVGLQNSPVKELCSHIAIQFVIVSPCRAQRAWFVLLYVSHHRDSMADSVVEDARTTAGAQRPKSEF